MNFKMRYLSTTTPQIKILFKSNFCFELKVSLLICSREPLWWKKRSPHLWGNSCNITYMLSNNLFQNDIKFFFQNMDTVHLSFFLVWFPFFSFSHSSAIFSYIFSPRFSFSFSLQVFCDSCFALAYGTRSLYTYKALKHRRRWNYAPAHE